MPIINRKRLGPRMNISLNLWASDDWLLPTTFWDLNVRRDMIKKKALPAAIPQESNCTVLSGRDSSSGYGGI